MRGEGTSIDGYYQLTHRMTAAQTQIKAAGTSIIHNQTKLPVPYLIMKLSDPIRAPPSLLDLLLKAPHSRATGLMLPVVLWKQGQQLAQYASQRLDILPLSQDEPMPFGALICNASLSAHSPKYSAQTSLTEISTARQANSRPLQILPDLRVYPASVHVDVLESLIEGATVLLEPA